MNNNNESNGQVVELMDHVSPEHMFRVSNRFEAIVSCQLHLIMQRGFPAEKLIEIVNDIQKQMQDASSEEVASLEKVSS